MFLYNNIKDLTFNDLLILIILIITFKILFFFSGFIQEDAFIMFRAAFNFAEYGNFSYNLDDSRSATTSKIFGLICSLLKVIFKEYAIYSITIFNSIISFLSSLVIFISLKELFNYNNKIFSRNDIFFLVVVTFLNPSISIISIAGLEFSILVLFMSLVLFGVIKDNKVLLSLVFFIPVIRIELIGFVLIFSFLYLYFLKWKTSLIILIFGIFGLLFNIYLNNMFDGGLIPTTAISKLSISSISNSFSLDRVIIDLNHWFFGERSFFLGIISKFIPKFIYTFSGILVLIYSFYNFKYLMINKFNNLNYKQKIFLISISASIIFLPLSYVISGVVWDWYLYPYSFLTYALIAIFLLNLKNSYKIKNIFVILIFTITIFQFLVLKNIGFQENSYRSVVGKDIFDLSKNPREDTLFLEPAGYIPYIAKIKTFDTEGLTSQEIFKFRNKNNKRWWLDFIEENRPTFIVDRKNIYDGFSHDGKYSLSETEITWFKQNYDLVKKYNYHKFVNEYSGIFKKFYLLGDHSDYFLYKKTIN
ncbi:hypothetical protein IDH21_02530 [Pelagibacterales bacterium SAG-MED47]|nr:hypothetical protein [Pelagibacterales bacterium SAG-MED47]